ncbi:Long-chain-fatty-acid--AMP ligase FadD32, partial [Aduncisulcus paluster]
GRMTLMSPMSFVRRPGRWIKELAAASHAGRTFGAAPNFAFELAAERGLPKDGETLDLSNVAGLINGSEPVSIASIRKFNEAFVPYGLPQNAIKPSYGMAEATLFVSSIAPDAEPSVIYVDREQLGAGYATRVDAAHENAMPQVTETELLDGQIGEIWLHGNNIGRGYWGRPEETNLSFHNKLQARLNEGSHATGTEPGAIWFRTGDLGVYVDGELYITGRVKDLVIVDGRNHYPHDIEATVEDASPVVRRGFVAAFSVPADELPAGVDAGDGAGERLVIVAERAAGAGRAEPGPIVDAIRAAVSRRHTLPVADYLLSVHSYANNAVNVSDADMERLYAQTGAVNEKMKEAGVWVFANGLTEPSDATVVRSVGGKVTATDGPYLETKEHLGGFWIINAPDLDAALKWAAEGSAACEEPVEPDESALETIGADVQAITRRMQEAGVWLFAAGLQPADTATMVVAGASGHTTTDGPYTETKEQLGGFSI